MSRLRNALMSDDDLNYDRLNYDKLLKVGWHYMSRREGEWGCGVRGSDEVGADIPSSGIGR